MVYPIIDSDIFQTNKMSEKEVIDYLQFCVLIYIAIFVTVIGFRQLNQNKDE